MSELDSNLKTITLGKYKIFSHLEHPLDIYFDRYPLYDRFLPHLCSNFKGVIIDVGANIGDTSIGIFNCNDEVRIIGVEPDEEFLKLCKKNISYNKLNERFVLINKFISMKDGAYFIEKNLSNSTGSKVLLDNSSSNSISFTTLYKQNLLNLDHHEFDLLKIDTDGYDWEIMESYIEMMDSYPKYNKFKFLFFEYQTYTTSKGIFDQERESRDKSYQRVLEKLRYHKYDSFCAFDNFGTLILTTNSISDIVELSKYIYRSQIVNKTSTIYHLDVLVYNSINKCFVSNKLKSFGNVSQSNYRGMNENLKSKAHNEIRFSRLMSVKIKLRRKKLFY